MTSKTVLVAGATGLVGYAAVKHFAAVPDTEVIALSRRPVPDVDVRHIALDLTDAAACRGAAAALRDVTHLVYAALFELPGLVEGWRDDRQIETNDRMLRNLLDPLMAAAPGLRHVTLLQGTKAYGVHVRPLAVPAREGRSEMREQPNFYWAQEDYLRAIQMGRGWHFTVLRPVLVVGEAIGGAMNLIPALGAHAAVMRERGPILPYPGGSERVSQAVDADLLARAVAWAGEAPAAANETFNVTNGDVFTWPNIWPAIAEAVGMRPGSDEPFLLQSLGRGDWDRARQRFGLESPALAEFVGLSLEYADYQMRYGHTEPGPPSIVSTVKIVQAGFREVMDTELMFRKWFKVFQQKRLLPPP
ncbi:NAD-dependent epimerase/dehydratase family protein [Acidisphaera sp. S103]|uniref:NAD-dependent epimerase/dehydratase family protein n=1 Tax=Acidisphaera sp. S103 TaxID=1747223 RepID=UPI00131C87CD|nr:NAD-dependent epimerase/dehydratase family protein [Acidisphaera sp. S103]